MYDYTTSQAPVAVPVWVKRELTTVEIAFSHFSCTELPGIGGNDDLSSSTLRALLKRPNALIIISSLLQSNLSKRSHFCF
jgi:hypothetical protein